MTEKINTQFIMTPVNTNYKNNPNPSTYTGSWHPSAHPLKIWRKSGTSQYLNTNIQNATKPCAKCNKFNTYAGKPFKMLGKYGTGVNKLTAVTNSTNCDLCDPTKGPKGTNSAGAKIRSANTNLNKKYYNSSSQYLKARCKSMNYIDIIQKKDGIEYFDAQGRAKWPSSNASTSAGTYVTNCCTDNTNACNVVTYKPSNPQYATQGAVDNSARLARLKYNTINTTNKSFKEAYQRNFTYTGSNNSLYFIKNKTQEPTQCCYSTTIRKLA